MQISTRHHYIPEFYLKRWGDAKGQLVQFSKPYHEIVKPDRMYPKETGFGRRLYSLEGVPRENSAFIEDRFFKPLDDRAAVTLQKMEAGQQSFDGAERVAWTQFVMSLLFRHPENVTAMKNRLLETLVKTNPSAEHRWRRQRKPGDPATLREAMRREIERDPTQVQRQALELVTELSGSEKIGTRIAQMWWGSIRLPLGVEPLFSSDRPVLKFGGLDDAGCHIMMPIGPRRIFYTANSREMANVIMMQPPAITAKFVNEQTVRRAVKYVYAMSDSNLAYVQANMGIEAEISLSETIMMLGRLGALRRMRRVFNPPGWKVGR